MHQTHTSRFFVRSLALWGKVCFGIGLLLCSQLALPQSNQTTKPNPTNKKTVAPQKGIQVNQRVPSKAVNSGSGNRFDQRKAQRVDGIGYRHHTTLLRMHRLSRQSFAPIGMHTRRIRRNAGCGRIHGRRSSFDVCLRSHRRLGCI